LGGPAGKKRASEAEKKKSVHLTFHKSCCFFKKRGEKRAELGKGKKKGERKEKKGGNFKEEGHN